MTPREVDDLRRWLEASGGLADGRPFLGDRRLDAMVDVLLEMAAQLWVLKRRNVLLEEALRNAGALPVGAVEAHVPSAETNAALRDMRADYVATIFRSLAELSLEPVDASESQEAA